MSTNIDLLEQTLPVAPLKIVAMESCRELGRKVNDYIVSFRENTINEVTESPLYVNYRSNNYLVDCQCPRFGTGEAKGVLRETIRGTDLFIMTDVCNYSLTYTVSGHPNHMSPDDHYQDLKRIISAATGKAHRINVIMPFLYESRQHKRTKRESLDCALALEELTAMGVSNIITFDAHDPRVQNAIPLSGFDSFSPAYQFMKAIFRAVPDLIPDKDHLMIISPDEGAMHRAVYQAYDDVHAVVHSHPLHASMFSALEESIDTHFIAESYYLLGEVVKAPYALMGTKELAENVCRALAGVKAVLLENHGALTTGATLLQAFERMEVLENAARMTYMCAQRLHPLLLDEARLDEIKRNFGG